jgi:hypothetical protein
MSTSHYRRKCPEGHVSLVTRRPERVKAYGGRIPAGIVYCDTCKQGYAKGELIEADVTDSNVSLGYVWSPSHDE